MARSGCDVCCNPTELARAIDSYRSSVLITLCDILSVLSGGSGGGENVNIAGIGGTPPSVGEGVSDLGTLRVTIASDSTGQVTLASGSTTNITFNNNTPALGNGIQTAATLRVTIASDSSGQVKLATGSVTSITFGGVTPTLGNGTAAGATLRVSLASDSTGQVKLAAGAAIIGALVANQTVNVAQLNGSTTETNNGMTTAGVQRVTISSDSTGQLIVNQASASALNAQVVGNIANDGLDSGNPVKIGKVATSLGTNPTAVGHGDRTDLYATRSGIPFTLGGHPNIITVEAAYTGAETDTAIITVGGGAKIVVTAIDFVCDNANTVNVAVRIGFGAATTPTTTGVILSHPGVAPGSGIIKGDGSGILGIGGDGDDLRITATAPTTGSMRVIVSYCTIDG